MAEQDAPPRPDPQAEGWIGSMLAERGELARVVIPLVLVGGALAYVLNAWPLTWGPLVLSLEVALSATAITLVIGTALALLLTRARLPGRDLIDAVISAPLVLPPTVLGYYLIVSLGPESAIGRAWEWAFGTQLIFSFKAAVIAAAVGSLPLVVRSARVGLESIEPNLINAARTLGASPLRVLVTIVLPLAAPGLIAGSMLGFARALGDYGATMMFAGSKIDGTPTGAIAVMDFLYGNKEAETRMMGLVMTLVGVSMLYVANRLTRRMHPHRV
jgi:molybdate transport system permease protein